MTTEKRTMINKMMDWIEVLRLQTAFVTCMALYLGFISIRSLDLHSFAILTIIGFLIHSWGFGQNNYYDYYYDKDDPSKQDMPLIKGEVDRRHLLIVTSLSIILAHIIVAFISIKSVSLLLSSTILGLYYNIYSKENIISEVALSGWGFLVVMLGSSIANETIVGNNITLILATIISIQLFVQIQEGSIKDIKGPETTFAERLGVSYGEYENGVPKINYTKKFKSVIYSLKGVEISLIWLLSLLTLNSEFNGVILTWIVIMAGLSILFFFSLDGWMYSVLNDPGRNKIKRMASIHEISSIILIGVGLMWLDQNAALLIIICPPLWYILVNRVIHKGSLNPDI